MISARTFTPGNLPRFHRFLHAAALVALFGMAGLMRFKVAQTPLIDPDVWGYLNPAISALTGHGFVHEGRDSLYPAFLFIVLKLTGDFRAISVVQHLLGLATGGLMLSVYRRGFLLVRGAGSDCDGLIRWSALLPAAAYLTTPSVIQFEQSLRPEAVFPFVAVLGICLNLEFIRRRWFAVAPTTAAWLGAAQLVVSAIASKLRPSFGFALLLVNLPLVVSVMVRGMPSRTKLLMATGAGLFFLLVLWLPEDMLARHDRMASLFLPDTLLTIHADQVRDQIAADLATGYPAPFPRDTMRALLKRLDATLALSRLPANHPYSTLGFNPDYLLYTDCVYDGVTDNTDAGAQRRAALGFFCYRRAFLRHPARMLGKIVRELHVFYHFGTASHASLFGKKFRLLDARAFQMERRYQRNVALFGQPRAREGFDEYPPARAFIETSLRLSRQPATVSQPRVLKDARTLLEMLYLPGLLASLLIAAWAAATGRLAQPEWLTRIAVTLLLFSYNFGNNLTVAVVHSLSISRYIESQLSYTLLASMSGIVLVGESVRYLLAAHRFQSRSQKSAGIPL